MAELHWAVSYIGKPWAAAASGPLAYDCWGLVRAVYQEQLGVMLPQIEPDRYELLSLSRAFEDADERLQNWTKVEEPREFDVILLGRSKTIVHCGIFIPLDGDSIMHCEQPLMRRSSGGGVVFQKLRSMRGMGWGYMDFVRHRSQLDAQ